MTTFEINYGPPQPGEFAPFYAQYISLARGQGDDILATLAEQQRQSLLWLAERTDADGELRYSPDKWSLKEVLGHINDTERIMSYRALRISRADSSPLPGFEQDDYVRNGPFARLQLADLIEEYGAVRRSTLSLFRNMSDAAWIRRGVANNNEVTVRAIAYVIVGHELHHRKIIDKEYLSKSL